MSLSLEGEGLKLWSVPLIHDPSSGVLSRRLRRISSKLLGKTKNHVELYKMTHEAFVSRLGEGRISHTVQLLLIWGAIPRVPLLTSHSPFLFQPPLPSPHRLSV